MMTRRDVMTAAAAGALLAKTHAAAPGRDDELTKLSIAEASRRLAAREISPVDLTRAYLERIERIDKRVNAYITVTAERALKQARTLERELMAGRSRGPLHGIPLGLKDNIDTAGVLTTAASAVYADRVPTKDAHVVTLLRDAGAVFLGKLNMHEFAYGATCVVTHYGPVRNPSQGDLWTREHSRHRAVVGDARSRRAARAQCRRLRTRDECVNRFRSARSREHRCAPQRPQ
jgi:hypothetical protein